MQLEAASGLVLIGATAFALLWANLPFGESYEKFWETHLLIELVPSTSTNRSATSSTTR